MGESSSNRRLGREEPVLLRRSRPKGPGAGDGGRREEAKEQKRNYF